MYKILVFLHQTSNEDIVEHFNSFTVKYFSELVNQELKVGKVESNPLLEMKFSLFVQIDFESKTKWEELIGSAKGEKLEKDLIDFHKYLTIIFIDYEYISN